MNPSGDDVDVAVIGAGNIGLAVAYYLVRKHRVSRIALVDPRDPMSLTSAQSGENYRNWWPHPVMTAFTDDSIGLMEEIARESGNRIAMTRRGYALATRRDDPADLIEDLYRGYAGQGEKSIRVHKGAGPHSTYRPAFSAAWEDAPEGVDVLCDRALIRRTFPTFAEDVGTVLHIRRAGSISGQQLGQYMLEAVRSAGGRLIRGEVVGIEKVAPFVLSIAAPDAARQVRADRVVNAAGPFFADVARLLGEDLPVRCVYQQKISFEDHEGAVPRNLPFTIDLDGQVLDWTEEERAILAEDPATARLTQFIAGGIHCRPDGAEGGKWIKLGWAFNEHAGDPHGPEPTDGHFPDIVLRAASRLQPALRAYVGRLPRGARHYGGYYTMTKENWPLIGPTATPGAFVAGALSGFGTMAACTTGLICADRIMETDTAPYASRLGLERYRDPAFMAELTGLQSKGVL